MKKTLPILVLNGPNLNMLGVRETRIYGKATLKDLETLCQKTAKNLKVKVDCRQSNLEGELVEWIQKSRKTHSGIIINAGGYSHTSVALLDALQVSELPVIEVHISNIYSRERFRNSSYISKVARGVIAGLGIEGYACALQTMAKWI
ncbi:MAG: type II 3-dehydroquinate dehydratase [Bdellovibrionales bacterium]